MSEENDMSERPTVIWKFATAGGVVRLLMEIDRDSGEQLHADLASCAIVADDLKQFMKLAHQVVEAQGGLIGELMKTAWPSRPFKDSIQHALKAPTTVLAAEATLKAAHGASREDVRRLLREPKWSVERQFISGVIYGLDELAEGYVDRLCGVLGVTVSQFCDALEIGRLS